MAELDPFGAETPILPPTTNKIEFKSGESLFNEISRAVNNGTKNFVIYGPEKSGKTSFTNVLPKNLPVGFIGVNIELEFLGEEPIYSVYDQIFSSVFRKLLENGYLEEKNEYYKSWRKQVNRGDLDIDPELELLALGSRIAFHLKNPTSTITIDKGLIQNDWLRLKNFTRDLYLEFTNFIFIFDDPQQIMNLDPKTQSSFFRLFETVESPLLVITANLLERSNKKEALELSLLDLLIERLPDARLDISLLKLDSQDISELIKDVRPELDPKKMGRVARSVQNITGGNPYLIKLLLNNIDKRAKATGKFEVDTVSCESLIDSQLLKLTPEAVIFYRTLKKLKATNTDVFLQLSAVLLATTQIRARPRSARKIAISHKSLTEIVLSNYAPKPINANLLDSELASYLKSVQGVWSMGLFNIIDNDGKTISANEVPDSSFISIQSKIVTDVDPLILAYLRISARELNNDFVIPSRQSYFSTTTNLFARGLVDFLLPENNESLSSRKIRAQSPMDNFEISEEGLTNRITQAVNENDLQSLFSHFYNPIRNTIIYNSHNSKTAFEIGSGTPVIFNVVLSELNLPEYREFSYILYLEPEIKTSDVEANFVSWLETNSPIMELFYKVKVVEHSFAIFPESLFKDLVFICGRGTRFNSAFDFFREGRFKELRDYLQDHLRHELLLIDQYEDFSESREGFQRSAQALSFMAASSGLFEESLKGFEWAIKDTYSNSIMIEDNKSVALANLGDLEKAADISWRNLKMLRDKRIEHDDYHKLVFIPFKSNQEILGSNAIQVGEWSLFTYELQHAILLLSKRRVTPLLQSERDFLSNFAEDLSQEMLTSFFDTSEPIHRMLAFYLMSVDSRAMACKFLEHFISTSNQTVQVQAAISDLDEIKAGGA